MALGSLMKLTNKFWGSAALALLILAGLWYASYWLTNIQRSRDNQTNNGLSDIDFSTDRDNDGVADGYETRFYNTDPIKTDTDDDEVSDLDEILAGRDPTTVGEGAPDLLTGETAAPEANFTQQYLASLPPDWPRENILNQSKLEAFVEANKGNLLLEVKISPEVATDNVQEVATYLARISSTSNPALTPVTSNEIAAAFLAQVRQQDQTPIDTIITNLTNNLAQLKKINPPAGTTELHQKLLAATNALLINTERLRAVNDDFVGGLIGAKNIEELGTVFRDIAQDVQALK